MSNIRSVYGEISTNNSSSTPLGIGATFTGVADDVTDFSMVTIFIHSDQASAAEGVSLEFSTDGTNWDRTKKLNLMFDPDTSLWGEIHTQSILAQFFRIVFINGAVAQTDFRMQIKYHTAQSKHVTSTIEEDVNIQSDVELVRAILTGFDDAGIPRNIKTSSVGSLKVGLVGSQTGARQIIDPNGAAKVGEAVILVGDAFGGKVPNVLQWTVDPVGSGSSLTLPGTQRIETGVTPDSEIRFQSTKKGRFMISQFNIYHSGVFVDNISNADCRRRWGAFDPINPSMNGAFFELDGGAWSVGTVKNGVTTLVPQANWNGVNKDMFNETPGLSVYEMAYNAGVVLFFQGTNLIHRVSVAATGGTYANEYNFNVGLEVVNSNGNTTNNGIEFRASGIYRLGEERGVTISRGFTADTLIKTGSGYCSNAYLSRTGSQGGSGSLIVYDGVDNTGTVMARVDIGGDAARGIPLNSTFTDGLFIEISGSGTNTVTIGYE